MAKRVYDIMLDEGYDLLITDGDLVIGESTRQHQGLLLLTEPGQIEQHPTAGVGITTWLLNDEADVTHLRHVITQQFGADGLKINKLDLRLPNIHIDANY